MVLELPKCEGSSIYIWKIEEGELYIFDCFFKILEKRGPIVIYPFVILGLHWREGAFVNPLMFIVWFSNKNVRVTVDKRHASNKLLMFQLGYNT